MRTPQAIAFFISSCLVSLPTFPRLGRAQKGQKSSFQDPQILVSLRIPYQSVLALSTLLKVCMHLGPSLVVIRNQRLALPQSNVTRYLIVIT